MLQVPTALPRQINVHNIEMNGWTSWVAVVVGRYTSCKFVVVVVVVVVGGGGVHFTALNSCKLRCLFFKFLYYFIFFKYHYHFIIFFKKSPSIFIAKMLHALVCLRGNRESCLIKDFCNILILGLIY